MTDTAEESLRVLGAFGGPDDGDREVEGFDWADLLGALMDGVQRGWVEEFRVVPRDGVPNVTWTATDRGDRAVSAYLRRSGAA